MKYMQYENEADAKNYFFFARSKNNVTPPHFHNNLEVMFVVSGSQRVAINGDERVLAKGNIVISSNYDVHFYHSVDESEVFILLAGGKYISDVYAEYGKHLINFLDCCGDFETVSELFQGFESQSQNANNLMRIAFVNYLFGYLGGRYEIKGEKKKTNDKMVEVLTYISDNYAENLTLNDLASRFGYTETYFSTLFNRYTGSHFREYLNRIRTEAVEEEVSKSGTSVTKAALSCGFDSLNTYYRARKKLR